MCQTGISGHLCPAVATAHLGEHMHGSTLRRYLSLAAIALAAMLAQPVFAQQCNGPWPDIVVFPDDDGVVYTGDMLLASLKPAPNATLTNVTVTVNGTAFTQTTFQPPGGDGRISVKYELVIDADKPSNPIYFEWALRMSHKGSLIIIDNVVRDGAVIDASSEDASVQGVRRLNEILATEKRVSSTVIQTVGVKGYDGLAVALVIADH